MSDISTCVIFILFYFGLKNGSIFSMPKPHRTFSLYFSAFAYECLAVTMALGGTKRVSLLV